MKKLLLSVLVIYIIYFSFGTVIDYSATLSDVSSDKEAISIMKPMEINNSDFVKELEDISNKLDVDILYSTRRLVNGEYIGINYITQNNADFLNLISQKNFARIKNGESVFLKTFIDKMYVQQFSDIKELNINECKYYITKHNADEFINELISREISVTKIQEQSFSDRFITPFSQAYPLTILAFTMIFLIFSRMKEFTVKRLSGYTTAGLIKEQVLSFLAYTLIISAVIFLITLTIHSLVFKNSFTMFAVFLLKRLALINLIVLSLFTLVSLLLFLPTNQLQIKGKAHNKELFNVTYVFKTIVGIVIVIYLSGAIGNVLNIYRMYRTVNFISEKTKNYIQVPINVTGTYINDDEYGDYLAKKIKLYNLTVDKFNGIIINTRNYENYNAVSMAEELGQIDITINNNYLSFNPIYDLEGQAISEENLDSRKYAFNLLIPKSLEHEIENINEKYLKWYSDDGLDLNLIKNIIYDDEKSKIFSYNSFIINGDNGEIKSPIIEIYNPTYLENQVGNYFGRHYILKMNSDDVYSEIYPYLAEAGLEKLIPNTPLVSDGFAEIMQNNKMELTYALINFILNIFGLITLIVYLSKLYCTNNRKKIACKRMNGYGFFDIYKGYILVQLVTSVIVVFLMLFVFKANLLIFLAFAFAELIIFLLITKSNERNYILNVMKEGC
ncbi:MAG: DUF1430 domain-containing protein [Clostridiales bacterium]|nr:DUF1430 domain-containing protein [Clostridiales bacterium]